MRTLVADVTLTSQVAGDEVWIGIRWRSGASEQIVARRPPPQYEAVRTPRQSHRIHHSARPNTQQSGPG